MLGNMENRQYFVEGRTFLVQRCHMDTRTDSDLMAAYAEACDENAFAELAARHQRMVYRVCLRMLQCHQEAEDATQAVFLVLLNKASRLTRKGELTGWLYGVARNVCLEALRTRARRQEEAMLDEIEVPAVVESRPDHEEVMPFLDEELAGLSGVLRQAVVLRYLQNHSEAEAAQRVGCAVGTLSMRASRGIERLRQRLAKRGVAVGGVALAGLLTSEASAAVPETLLPSILATVKTAAATGAAATTATSTAATLAKGAMKAMYIAKVKMVAAVVAAVVVTGTVVPVGIAVAQAASKEEESSAKKTDVDAMLKQAQDLLSQGRKAEAYEKAGKTAEAISAYRATLTKYPNAPEAALAHSALEKMGSRSPDATHVPLAGKAAELEKKAQEAKVTLSLKEMTADNALDRLSMSGITIRKTDIPKDAKISLEMRDASVLDGVKRVTEMLGLTYVIVDDAIEVSGKKKE
jgi:RNA polymerase sigma factor (sigma-70 family)